MGTTGLTPIDHGVDLYLAEQLGSVINKAYMDGIAINGDFARYNAQVIAAAASRGLITSCTPEGLYGRIWRPTQSGMLWAHTRQEGL